MNKKELVDYISREGNIARSIVVYWLPVLMQSGQENGYHQWQVVRSMIIMGIWGNEAMAMQGLHHYFCGIEDKTTFLVVQQLARWAYRHVDALEKERKVNGG